MPMNQMAMESEAPVFRLIYRSRIQIPASRRKLALGAIFSEARSNNKSKHITGALLVGDDWFVQTLEGQEVDVRGLYQRIETDPRHDSFSVLEERNGVGRFFARWSMAEVSPGPDEADTFLLAHRDGISPAASLRPTPEQESILQVMRVAARGGSHQPGDIERQDDVPAARARAGAGLRPTSM